jgi:hypothetical protein
MVFSHLFLMAVDWPTEKLANVPQLASLNLGPLFRSTQPAELTESETEYTVQVSFSPS